MIKAKRIDVHNHVIPNEFLDALAARPDYFRMRIDGTGRVQGFLEKPKTDDELKLVRTDAAWFNKRGIACGSRGCVERSGHDRKVRRPRHVDPEGLGDV